MRGSYVIAMDVHSYTSQIAVLTPSGRERLNCSVPTSIPAVRKVVRSTPRPRRIVFEEGPLAGWMYRNLHAEADEVIVAETRRNAYVARDGDKSDPIDAVKLAQLERGGFIRPVHHHADERRASFKELTMFHRRCVKQRVSQANRVIWAVRERGLVVRARHFAEPADRALLLEQLPATGCSVCGWRCCWRRTTRRWPTKSGSNVNWFGGPEASRSFDALPSCRG